MGWKGIVCNIRGRVLKLTRTRDMSNVVYGAIVIAKGLQMMAEQTTAGTRTSDGEGKAFTKAGVGKGELWRGIKSK